MKIEYVTGDMFRSEHALFIHGCNAQGAYRSGVAGIMRDQYPDAYRAYRDKFEASGLKLGEVVWYFGDTRTIANGITQEFYGRDAKRRYVDYDAVRSVIRTVNDFCRATQSDDVQESGFGKIESAALPLIGAGLGGGEWSMISSIIEEEATSFQPVVYLLDGKIPG